MTFTGARRLGLMGGTFNPVHLGHLRAAEEISEHLGLDRVVFMPAARAPHKPGLDLASFGHRLTMLNFAVRGQDRFRVSDLEDGLPGPSYTANTLEEVAARLDEGCRLFFLVGFDSFRTVGQWHRCLDLFRLASFVVFRRPGLGSGLSSVGEVLARILGPFPDMEADGSGQGGTLSWAGFQPVHYYPGCRLEISSTDLRNRLVLGDSVRYLVPDSVREYIEANSLYHS
ncbi:MAG: nicotinate-nucleotide adenylyltransferase [Deltaproteobacteria bacterium]|jgi:nicotinate-nucleotide adenylyltransferase|nr:nicotinate-nucleotide adenylyltransferase [Deltaproteobacteria bacterium]